MVVGTMIGSGIYLLPTTLAPFGPNLVVAFAITIAGTMCLAIAFAKLAGRLPGGRSSMSAPRSATLPRS